MTKERGYSLKKVEFAIDRHYGTQKEFSEAIGLHQPAISYALNRKRDKTLKAIILYLIENNGYSFDDFTEDNPNAEDIEKMKADIEHLTRKVDNQEREISIIKRAITD